MTSVIQPSRASVFRKGSTIVLAFVWILGLLCGLILYFLGEPAFSSLMRGIVFGSASIVGLMLSCLLPFLFSAFAVFLSQPWLLLPIGFFKAFLLSFVSIGIVDGFGSAGWLLRLFLMFSEILTAPLLYWYMYRHLHRSCCFFSGEFLGILAVCVWIGSMDHGYVLPFLAGMINS